MNFKDFAQRASQAGTRFAAQVKEQQQRISQRIHETGTLRPIEEGVVDGSLQDDTIQLLQIQNDKLRDKLRTVLQENEELRHQLKQPQPSHGDVSSTTFQEGQEQEPGKRQSNEDIEALQKSLSEAEERERTAMRRLEEQRESMEREMAVAVQRERIRWEKELKDLQREMESQIAAAEYRHTREVDHLRRVAEEQAERWEEKERNLRESLASEMERRMEEVSSMHAAEIETFKSQVSDLQERKNTKVAAVESPDETGRGVPPRTVPSPDAVNGAQSNGSDSFESERGVDSATNDAKNSLTTQATTNEIEKDAMATEIEDLKAELIEAQKDHERHLAEQQASFVSKIADLQDQLAEHSSQREDELQRFKTLQDEMSLMVRKLEDAQKKISAGEEERGWLRQGAQELTRQLEILESESREHQRRADEVEQELDRLRRAKSSSSDEAGGSARETNDAWQKTDAADVRPSSIQSLQKNGNHAEINASASSPPHTLLKDDESIPSSPPHGASTDISMAVSRTKAKAMHFVPHHRRDASYSSEIEPLSDENPDRVDTRKNEVVRGGHNGTEEDLKRGDVKDLEIAGAASVDSNPGAPLEKSPYDREQKEAVEPSSRDTPPPAYEDVVSSGLVSDLGAQALGQQPMPKQEAGATNAMQMLQAHVDALRAEIEDNQRTHELRDKATAVLKEEIESLRRMRSRSSVDLTYLKEVLVKAFASGELSGPHMIPVLARLLEWSPEEVAKAQKQDRSVSHRAPSTMELSGVHREAVAGRNPANSFNILPSTNAFNMVSLFGGGNS